MRSQAYICTCVNSLPQKKVFTFVEPSTQNGRGRAEEKVGGAPKQWRVWSTLYFSANPPSIWST